jgi:hypothetical protein
MNNEKQQTAVEWLYHQIVIKNSDVLKFRQYLEEAKEMEKEQKNNMPIHIHEGISNTWVYIEDGVVHVMPNDNDLEMVKQCQFEIDNSTSSATKCKWCGRDKWEHIKYGGNN